jgi:PAS domain S-box-containing protein
MSAPVSSTILDSISDGVFTVDEGWRITSFNRAAQQITGISQGEALGRRCAEVFRANLCEDRCPLRATMESERPVINQQAFIVDPQGRRIPISISTALIRDASGRVVGGAETFRDLSLVEELRRELHGRYRVGDMLSRSQAMQRIFEVLPAVAASAATVLIQGETGTGKELVARAIHERSPRRGRPFVAVNCAAFPETLLESELFGVRKGAYTGAQRDRPGRFDLAQGGTLFLDEVGEMSPAMQVKLLRVLQERTYEPLGSPRSVKADVRILAATHRDLKEEVERGRFREDLFYRINVVRIDLPTLRARPEDVPLLVEHFVMRFNRLQGKNLMGVDPRSMEILLAHDWPGNVRELENAIEHGFVLCSQGCIQSHHLPQGLSAGNKPAVAGETPSLQATVRAAEQVAILDALARNGDNRDAAAKELGIHRSTLFRKVRELGITLPDNDGRRRREG